MINACLKCFHKGSWQHVGFTVILEFFSEFHEVNIVVFHKQING